jgi:NAD(P)-dependent dehydrogenase (short-subunit alcohol dehydrogenase family)
MVQILLTYELGERFPLDQAGVIINCVNPGICITDLTRSADPQTKERVHGLRDQMGRTPEVGSRTLYHSTVAGPESHGKFLSECKVSE